MQELRFVAVSEDGRYAVLAVPGRSARFTLPIDERLRAVALGQTSRLAQYEIEVESPLRPKEIQARIRAGETVEEIADAAGIAVERVRWFEGPVLAERAYVAQQAQTASVRRPGESTPGPRLGDITAERLSLAGADPDDVQWDARKRGDGNWQVQLTFTTGGRLHVAEWLYDPRRRHVIPSDDAAARMSLPGSELPEPVSPGHGEATVTRLAPRLRHDPPVPVTPPPAAAAAAGPAGAPPPAYSGSTTAETAHRAASSFSSASSADQARHESPARETPAAREAAPAREAAATREAPAAEAGESVAATPERPAEPEPATPREAVAYAPPAPTPAAPATGAAPAQPAADQRPAAPATTAPAAAVPANVQPAAASAAASQADAASAAAGHAEAATPASAQPAADGVRKPAAEATPAATAAPTPAAAAETNAPSAPARGANADANGEQAGRPGRKNARGRRSSVPSWDEIMLGSSRQRD